MSIITILDPTHEKEKDMTNIERAKAGVQGAADALNHAIVCAADMDYPQNVTVVNALATAKSWYEKWLKDNNPKHIEFGNAEMDRAQLEVLRNGGREKWEEVWDAIYDAGAEIGYAMAELGMEEKTHPQLQEALEAHRNQ